MLKNVKLLKKSRLAKIGPRNDFSLKAGLERESYFIRKACKRNGRAPVAHISQTKPQMDALETR